MTVTVTPTYSGCPALQVIEDDIRSALVAHGIDDVKIEMVYAPAWTTDWLGPEAREKLRVFGIAPPGPAEVGGLITLTRRRAVPKRQREHERGRGAGATQTECAHRLAGGVRSDTVPLRILGASPETLVVI